MLKRLRNAYFAQTLWGSVTCPALNPVRSMFEAARPWKEALGNRGGENSFLFIYFIIQAYNGPRGSQLLSSSSESISDRSGTVLQSSSG